jgi:hypothetical protein
MAMKDKMLLIIEIIFFSSYRKNFQKDFLFSMKMVLQIYH